MSNAGSGSPAALTTFGNASVQSSTTSTDVRNQNLSDSAGDTFGNKLQLSESTIGTFSTSDFGAIAAAKDIAIAGEAAASDAATRATDAARAGLTAAGKVLTNASQENLAGLLKIGGWVAVALFGLWLLFKSTKKGKPS